MKLGDIFPSKYIKASDLQGKNVTLTIRRCSLEEMGVGPEKEKHLVVWFQKTDKGLICNRTNANVIGSLYGEETDEWVGKRIIIYPTTVRAFGKTHEVIRVREQAPPPPGEKAPPVPQTIPVEEPGLDDHSSQGQSDALDWEEDMLDAEDPDNDVDFYPSPAKGLESPLAGDQEVPNPFEDGAPFFKTALAHFGQNVSNLAQWGSALHRQSDGPAAPVTSKMVCSVVDEIAGGKQHNEVLSVIAQSYISDKNRIGAALAEALLKHLLPSSPDYEPEMAETIREIAHQKEPA